MAQGALLNPVGNTPELLTEKEHRTLMECLRAIRADGNSAETIHNLGILQRSDGTTTYEAPEYAPEHINFLAGRYLEEHSDSGNDEGLLMRCFSESAMWHLSDSELPTLIHTLQVLRAGGWFGSWLGERVKSIATATAETPAEQFPTPLQIMGTLSVQLESYSGLENIAREFAEQRPDLLFPVMRCEGDAVPDIVDTSVIQTRKKAPAEPEAPPTMAEALKSARAVVAGLERELRAAEKHVGLKPGQRIGEKAPTARKRHRAVSR